MPIEHETRDGKLIWIRNPVTGVISYVVDVRAKSFAFTVGRGEHFEGAAPRLSRNAISLAKERCPFCPGNESHAPAELFRVTPAEMPEWEPPPELRSPQWVMRVFNNLFPRIPTELTGNRNESYVVVEDPRHFAEPAHSAADLIHTGSLPQQHFLRLLEVDVKVMRHSMANPAVRSIVVRKNQGREAGASQPHVHQQIIGSPEPFPVVRAESHAEHDTPGLFEEQVLLMDRLGLVIERRRHVVSYASPIGTFPRSYDVIVPASRGRLLSELSNDELAEFGGALHNILRVLGSYPLDYEIHQGESLPLHAHVNARHYPYANVAGTLNLPDTLLESAAAIRRAIESGGYQGAERTS